MVDVSSLWWVVPEERIFKFLRLLDDAAGAGFSFKDDLLIYFSSLSRPLSVCLSQERLQARLFLRYCWDVVAVVRSGLCSDSVEEPDVAAKVAEEIEDVVVGIEDTLRVLWK